MRTNGVLVAWIGGLALGAGAQAAELVACGLCPAPLFAKEARECAAGSTIPATGTAIDVDKVCLATAVRCSTPEKVYHVWSCLASGAKTLARRWMLPGGTPHSDPIAAIAAFSRDKKIAEPHAVVFVTELSVRPAPRFRTHSSKTLHLKGPWRVEVFDSTHAEALCTVEFEAQ